jgi:hypothetical protein
MKCLIRIIVYGVIGGGMLLGFYALLTVPSLDTCNPHAFYHPFC